MESNVEEEDQKNGDLAAPQLDQPFDPEYAAAVLQLTLKQKKFADAILAGCNQTQAAELAGYSGSRKGSLRSTASDTANSDKVVSYLAWARAGRSGLPTDPATLRQIQLKLTETMNGSDKNASNRAAEILLRDANARAEAARDRPFDPIAGLNDLARISEFGLLAAIALARANNVSWEPPVPPAPDAEARQVEQLRAAMTPADRQRADFIIKRQNSLSTTAPVRDGQVAPPSSDPPPGDGGAAVGNELYDVDRLAAVAFRGSNI